MFNVFGMKTWNNIVAAEQNCSQQTRTEDDLFIGDEAVPISAPRSGIKTSWKRTTRASGNTTFQNFSKWLCHKNNWQSNCVGQALHCALFVTSVNHSENNLNGLLVPWKRRLFSQLIISQTDISLTSVSQSRYRVHDTACNQIYYYFFMESLT